MDDRKYEEQRCLNSASWSESKAEHCRTRADILESDHPDLAKRYREAAHRQAESAAWLRGEREGATPADVEPTPPMTIERAVEVLNANRHSDGDDWRSSLSAFRTHRLVNSASAMCTFSEFEAIAIAERYLRDAAAAPAKEVG